MNNLGKGPLDKTKYQMSKANLRSGFTQEDSYLAFLHTSLSKT